MEILNFNYFMWSSIKFINSPASEAELAQVTFTYINAMGCRMLSFFKGYFLLKTRQCFFIAFLLSTTFDFTFTFYCSKLLHTLSNFIKGHLYQGSFPIAHQTSRVLKQNWERIGLVAKDNMLSRGYLRSFFHFVGSRFSAMCCSRSYVVTMTFDVHAVWHWLLLSRKIFNDDSIYHNHSRWGNWFIIQAFN